MDSIFKPSLLIWLIFMLLFSCSKIEKNTSNLDKWSQETLEGISVKALDDGWYTLRIDYPAGFPIKVDSGFIMDKYFQFALSVILSEDTIFSRANDSSYPLFILNRKAAMKKIPVQGFNENSFAVLDTSFIVKGDQIYLYRLKNIYNKRYTDGILGADLALFISKEQGIVGMYISKDGNELFSNNYKEIMYYPKGQIFYKETDPHVKVVTKPYQPSE